MKDTQAKKDIEGLKERLGGLSVRQCKECGHRTLQERSIHYNAYAAVLMRLGKHNYEYDYTCLTCGTEWYCYENTETICERVGGVVETPKKAKKKPVIK